MRLNGKRSRPRMLGLMAGVLVPLLAVAGVAEQMCWCVDEDQHDAGTAQAHEERDPHGDIPGGDHRHAEAAHGHLFESGAGHDECTCVRTGVALAELSQPVQVDGKVGHGALIVVAPPRTISIGLVRGESARARAARSEHPPPLFLSHCSWRC